MKVNEKKNGVMYVYMTLGLEEVLKLKSCSARVLSVVM